MRILLICTNFRPGGIQRHVLDLARDLRGMGHAVTVAADAGDWRAAAAADGPVIDLPLNAVAAAAGGGKAARVAALARTALALRRHLRQGRFDLIHAHETAPALVARLARLGRRVPIVMTYHGAAPAREASVARTGNLCADIVVSPSATSLDALIAKGLSRDKARVIPNAVPAPPPEPPEAVAALRARLLDGRAGPLVISLSRLDAQKGIDVMVDVLARLIPHHPGVVLAIAGGGTMRDPVEAWARAAGVTDHLRLLGPVSTVPLHLQASDLFLLTSRWENLPISIIEAFRAGLPVVATDCGGVRELVGDGVGALCAVDDAPGIAAAVSALLADPALRRQKGDAARAFARGAGFDAATVHARFAALYAGLVAPR